MKITHFVTYTFPYDFKVPKRYQFYYTKDSETWSKNERKLAEEWVNRLYDKAPDSLKEVEGTIECFIDTTNV